MVKDYWPTLYSDPYAVKRIQKSIQVANLKEGMSVLDVGCHRGELEKFIPLKIFYYGIDKILGSEIDGGFQAPQKYDRIFCLEVLEHLVNPEGTIESIKAHLKDDGLAVISLPNEATIFHRFRGLLGVMDGECFSSCGKHLHLPSLKQSRKFISVHFDIVSEHYYISPEARGSRQAWIGSFLKLIPSQFLQTLANMMPSLFARGFIFKLKKK